LRLKYINELKLKVKRDKLEQFTLVKQTFLHWPSQGQLKRRGLLNHESHTVASLSLNTKFYSNNMRIKRRILIHKLRLTAN